MKNKTFSFSIRIERKRSCCLVLLYREILKENPTLIGIGVQSKVPSICSQRALIHSARLFCFLPIALFIPILFFLFFSFGHLFPPLDGDTGVPARVFGWGIGRWKAWRRKGGDVKRKKAKEKSKKKKRGLLCMRDPLAVEVCPSCQSDALKFVLFPFLCWSNFECKNCTMWTVFVVILLITKSGNY